MRRDTQQREHSVRRRGEFLWIDRNIARTKTGGDIERFVR